MSYGSFAERTGFSLTPWVRRILVANAAVYLVSLVVPDVFMNRWFGFVPAEILFRPWGIFTYMFVHGGFWHVLLNMLVVFFFGPPLEQRLGGTEFLKLYLLAGLGGALMGFIFAFDIAVIGASGAAFGLMLAFAWYWPNAPIYIWGIFPVKAKYLVGFFFVLTFFSAFFGAGGGVAHFAHLGGLLAGVVYLKSGGELGARLGSLKKAARVERLAIVPRDDAEEEERTGARRPRRGRKARMAEKELLDEVDRILDKISDSGMASLTDEERKILDEVSKRRRTH